MNWSATSTQGDHIQLVLSCWSWEAGWGDPLRDLMVTSCEKCCHCQVERLKRSLLYSTLLKASRWIATDSQGLRIYIWCANWWSADFGKTTLRFMPLLSWRSGNPKQFCLGLWQCHVTWTSLVDCSCSFRFRSGFASKHLMFFSLHSVDPVWLL